MPSGGIAGSGEDRQQSGAPRSRILVVEDDTDFGNQLADLFQYHGHEVVLARDGASAVDLFRESPPDLIVCDLMLPIQNGMKVIEEIRGAPGGDRVPAIMVSAVYRNPALFAQDLRRIGVERFIAKPFSLLDLGREVDELLRTRPATRAVTAAEAASATQEGEGLDAKAERTTRDHRQRLGLDHYEFLGVSAEAAQSDIEAAYRDLAPRYRVSEAARIPEEIRALARELLLHLIESYEVLSDPDSRRAYDQSRAMALRQAVTQADPLEVDLPRMPAPIREPVASALHRARRGEVDEALQLLHDLRRTWPASGEILVAQGWVRFLGAGTGARAISEEALHSLHLALAYDPDLAVAHRCLAAVYAALGRRGEVVHHLQALLQLRPDDAAARQDLERLGGPATT